MAISVSAADAQPPHSPILRGLSLRTRYRTGRDDLVRHFYAPCLAAATKYDRAVGYFRSSIFVVAGRDVVDFARRGGTVRLVCSPELTDVDRQALRAGYDAREVVFASLDRDIERLLANVDLRQRATTLATLITAGALEVRLAFRTTGGGLFHEKLGLFVDDSSDEVSFEGSSNETWSGWDRDGNGEAFSVFCSWQPHDADRVRGHRADFERLWGDDEHGVETVPFPEVALDRLRAVAADSLDALAEALADAEPRPLGGRSPFPHQSDALAGWVANGRRGILEHATGSGKTFTALLALDDHLGDDGAALVLVPSRLLLSQWADEVKSTLPDVTLLQAGGGHSRWRSPGAVEAFTGPPEGLGRRVTLATMQTAANPEFSRRVQGGGHLLVVADEVHRTGSPHHRAVFALDAGARLGLSATPHRYGDPEGTQALLNYFGGVVPPPFTLADAVAAGRLVPYHYHPHTVSLTPEEQEAWLDLTLQIRKAAAIEGGGDGEDHGPLSDRLKRLLIRRARIAKKAEGKVDLAARVVADYAPGDRWLVYCEDTGQLEAVRDRLRADGRPVSEYHTSMDADEHATLDWFRDVGGVLVSIRCLDEGVDIPQASHALILASSQNPREFIQRRGRVLRVAPTTSAKHVAVIHDALVVPDTPDDGLVSLVKTEVRRAVEFADHALNGQARLDLAALALRLGLGDEDPDDGLEDDDPAIADNPAPTHSPLP